MRVLDGELIVKLTMGVALAFAASATPRSLAAAQSQAADAGAVQQSNSSSDIAITRNIRRALIKDKSLSMGAHNVTIITRDGKVILKGQVDSGAEKQTVESTAAAVAGAQNVQSQLTTSK